MGSLYIGGAQCKFADMDDQWEEFDKQKKDLSLLSANFQVFVNRYDLDDDEGCQFVVSHQEPNHECFYAGAAFEYDMSVEVSDTFESRANEFIKALNNAPEFSKFHNLEWSRSKVLYFVTS